jgi:hypothetical protein
MRHHEILMTALVAMAAMTGCATNTVTLVYEPEEHKVVLHPMKGTVLKWSTADGKPVPVQFPFGNPCKDSTEIEQGQCTISVDKAKVPYLCTGCADPEIVVGTDISPVGHPTVVAAVAAPPNGIVYMACDAKAASIYPTTVTIPKADLAAGASILWTPGGLTPIPSDWTADNFSSPVCSNSPPFNGANSTCNLKKDLAVGTPVTYTVSSATCGATSAQGTITIQ